MTRVGSAEAKAPDTTLRVFLGQRKRARNARATLFAFCQTFASAASTVVTGTRISPAFSRISATHVAIARPAVGKAVVTPTTLVAFFTFKALEAPTSTGFTIALL